MTGVWCLVFSKETTTKLGKNETLLYGAMSVPYGSQELCLLREQRSLQLRTCRRRRTTGCSPGKGENVLLPLPRPPETRAGKRAAVLSARPIFLALLGTGGIMEGVRKRWDGGVAQQKYAQPLGMFGKR